MSPGALEAVEREPELADQETIADARELLAEIVGQEFAADAMEMGRKASGVAIYGRVMREVGFGGRLRSA